ncbi:MAG: hypothetical protein KatS3mg105_2838 [Gemmatales bacterium]|nr:MAG: hypothetical protein KatS3mg105_2838 [Gemmatales bacterium]
MPCVMAVIVFFVSAGRAQSDYSNCRLTLECRRVLAAEPSLRACQIGVSVRNHVATLWGTVTSVTLSRQAERLVGKVLGIASVNNELKVIGPGHPDWQFLRMPKMRMQPRPALQTNQMKRKPVAQLLHGKKPVRIQLHRPITTYESPGDQDLQWKPATPTRPMVKLLPPEKP